MNNNKLSANYYLGNKNLKNVGVSLDYTQFQLDEYVKCSLDPIHFIKNYVKIVHVDRGVIPFALYPFQERIIRAYQHNRKVICKIGRQQGKTQTTAAFFLWFILFHSDKMIAVLANKAAVAREILSRIKFAYENLPIWLQQGIVEWNKGTIILENGSGIISAATSANAIRGFSVAAIYIDETAFIPQNIAEEFFTSVFPTISSGKQTKIFLSSTPKGLNHFHKMWTEAVQGISDFIPIEAHWHENPERDAVWLAEQRKVLGEVKFSQECLCAFLGSSRSLISGVKLGQIATLQPVHEKDSLKIYINPIKGHSYVMTVDTSRGQHLDYSAFTVFDITSLPYQAVATYKNNYISPSSYPYLILQLCELYNHAHCLIEVNDLGEMVSSTLFYEFEYENVYFTYKDELNEGRGYPGVRTTKKVKSVGCATLKDMIETDQLIINSHDTLSELSVFVQKGASYAADDEAINDDLTTCHWLFAWLTKQALFAELTDTNIRSIMAKKTEEYITENMMPLGGISTGLDDPEDSIELDINRFGGSSGDPFLKWVMS